MKKVATKAEQQAASAAIFKHLSEQKLADAEQSSAKKSVGHSINAVEADLKKTQAVLISVVQKDQRLHADDPDKLNQRISQAKEDANHTFKRQSKPEIVKTPWYAVFCCCVKPVDDEKQPLYKGAH